MTMKTVTGACTSTKTIGGPTNTGRQTREREPNTGIGVMNIPMTAVQTIEDSKAGISIEPR
jgi:hypothetical protein